MRTFAISMVSLFLFTQAAVANDAVSALNAKIESVFGNVDGSTAKAGAASLAFPVLDDFGVQIDGLAGKVNPSDAYGSAVHAFWRDSTVGLVGLTAAHAELGKTETLRYGGEAEYYLDQFTFTGYVGQQSGDIDTSAYAGLGARYYLTDDVMFSTVASTSDDLERYALALEAQTPVRGLSWYASLATGENDYDHAFFGLKFYFSGDRKSLIDRHRQDDPSNGLWDAVTDLFMAQPRTTAPVIQVN